VRIYVSTGDGKAEVPDVLGKSQNEATRLLEDAGFVVAVNEVYDETVPEGEVISQSVKPEDRIAEGSTITIDVSTGPQPTEPPTETTAPTTQSEEPTEASEDAQSDEPTEATENAQSNETTEGTEP